MPELIEEIAVSHVECERATGAGRTWDCDLYQQTDERSVYVDELHIYEDEKTTVGENHVEVELDPLMKDNFARLMDDDGEILLGVVSEER